MSTLQESQHDVRVREECVRKEGKEESVHSLDVVSGISKVNEDEGDSSKKCP